MENSSKEVGVILYFEKKGRVWRTKTWGRCGSFAENVGLTGQMLYIVY